MQLNISKIFNENISKSMIAFLKFCAREQKILINTMMWNLLFMINSIINNI